MAYYGYNPNPPIPNNPVSGGERPPRPPAGSWAPPGGAYIPPGNANLPPNPYVNRGPGLSALDRFFQGIGSGNSTAWNNPTFQGLITPNNRNAAWQQWNQFYKPPISQPLTYQPPAWNPDPRDVGGITPPIGNAGGEYIPPPITGGGGKPPIGGQTPEGGGVGGAYPPLNPYSGGWNPDPRDTMKLGNYGGYVGDPRQKFALRPGMPQGGSPYGISQYRQGGWF